MIMPTAHTASGQNAPSSQKNAHISYNPFSRSSTLFVSNRKKREAAAADQTSPHKLTKSPPFAISPPIAEHDENPNDSPKSSELPESVKSEESALSPTSHAREASDQSLPPALIPSRTSSKRSHRHSSSQHNIDLQSLRRSVSLRSVSSPHRRAPSTASTIAGPQQNGHNSLKPLLHLSFAKRQKSADALSALSFQSTDTASTTAPSLSSSRSNPMINMPAAVSYRSGQAPAGRPPGASISSVNTFNSQSSNGTMQMPPPVVAGSQTPQMIYQHIMDTASKRISTLDYLRKAHEGRVYWFNTLLFTKPDLLRFPFFQPSKLARRATNYLLLGFSLPTILDLNSQTPTEYLKALNALLVEFEQFQQLHPPDGSIPSSLSRARVPQMFKRTTIKSRRQSSAADFSSSANGGGGGTTPLDPTPPAFPSDPYAQENYTHLLTPSLPFDPDFFETFATLCDVLIDCYTKVTQLVRGPEMCAPGPGGVGELFGKADARVRKVIVAGTVREFEERCREGVRSEVAGVGKVVLGGLM